MKQLVFKVLLGIILFSSVALSLESYDSFRTGHPDAARQVQPTALIVKGSTDDVMYYLEADPTSGAIPVSIAASVKSIVDIHRHDYSSVNVTTGAYIELIASTSGTINRLYIFDSSGETLVLATGAAASEVDLFYITPGGNGEIDVQIASGTRLSVKAVSATASAGEFTLNATD